MVTIHIACSNGNIEVKSKERNKKSITTSALIQWIYLFNISFLCHSKQMKDAWDERRTVEHNLRDMGLSADPNQTLPVPTPAVSLLHLRHVNCKATQNLHVVLITRSIISERQSSEKKLSLPDTF